MFQALMMMERDARGDLKKHRQIQLPRTDLPEIVSPKTNDVTITKHPTRAKLIGGKGLFCTGTQSNPKQ